jgi:hypothetical protein
MDGQICLDLAVRTLYKTATDCASDVPHLN